MFFNILISKNRYLTCEFCLCIFWKLCKIFRNGEAGIKDTDQAYVEVHIRRSICYLAQEAYVEKKNIFSQSKENMFISHT